MYFGEIAFPGNEELGEALLRGISKSWIWFDSGTTSESKLFSCRATVEKLQLSSARQKHDVWTGPQSLKLWGS